MFAINAREARDRFAEILGRVEYGRERVVITRYGREIAAVVRIADARLMERLEALIHPEDVLLALDEAERRGSLKRMVLRERLRRVT